MNISVLDEALTDLLSQSADNFAPIRFAAISRLRRRLESDSSASQSVEFETLKCKIEAYREDLSTCRKSAQKILSEIADDFPDHQESAKILFDECKFNQLSLMGLRLAERRKGLRHVHALAQLKNQMNARLEKSESTHKSLTFDELLDEQELKIRKDSGFDLPTKTDGSGEQLELQSMKYFRESMKYFNVDQIIDKAINDSPENPGPHNPKMLAIKSLIQMRDLSPQYLRRFTGYIETILWLEKNSSKLSNG